MKEAIATFGIVLINEKDEVLLVQAASGSDHVRGAVGLPAGRPDPNESPIETAIREGLEETGVAVKPELLTENPKEYRAEIKRKDGTTKLFSIRVFGARIGDVELVSNDETRPIWVKIADLGNFELLPNTHDIIIDTKELL